MGHIHVYNEMEGSDNMTKYEEILDQAHNNNVPVYENYNFSNRIKGLYCDGSIVLNQNLATSTEKACVLAEELGHHDTAVGNIINQSTVENRKQEMRGRLVAYNKMVGLRGLVEAYNHHCCNLEEVADYLEVTPEFLQETIDCYRSKYGVYAAVDNYVIFFEPCLGVLEIQNNIKDEEDS